MNNNAEFAMEHSFNNITYEDIVSALTHKLPGESAHEKFLPSGRTLDIPENKSDHVKVSAVMVLLIMDNNTLSFCLTMRSKHMKNHPGQISFPGGKVDNNENIRMAALRELEEELGINRNEVMYCGKLSPLYISVSNFLIHPIVGFIGQKPSITINYSEVDDYYIIPLKSFFESKHITKSTVETSLGEIEVPAYKINDIMIWGATAMIIAEFIELLRSFFHSKE